MSDFEKELRNLINMNSIENESDTPDWILAQYLTGCLDIFAKTTKQRDKWYGLNLWPKETATEPTGKELIKKLENKNIKKKTDKTIEFKKAGWKELQDDKEAGWREFQEKQDNDDKKENNNE